MGLSIKGFAGAVTAMGLVAGTLVITPAAAEHGHNAAAIAGGLLGGVAAGAIISGAGPGYYGPGPVYAQPVYGPPPGCIERRPVYDTYGNFAGYRPVRIC